MIDRVRHLFEKILDQGAELFNFQGLHYWGGIWQGWFLTGRPLRCIDCHRYMHATPIRGCAVAPSFPVLWEEMYRGSLGSLFSTLGNRGALLDYHREICWRRMLSWWILSQVAIC